MFVRSALVVLLLCVSAASSAQTTPITPQTTPTARPPEPPLRRWLDLQAVSVGTRYRVIENSRDTVTSNDLQYKESVRARVNLDAKRRYSVNVGFFSGSNFSGSWDNTGLGINDGDYHSHYVKQLFAAAAPVDGLEMQFGGLYIVRGESTEYTTYDEDGYLVGGRASLKRPKEIYLDEVSVTYGAIGPMGTPNLFERWDELSDPNYTHVLATKRFTPMVAASADYTMADGAEGLHAALALRFKPGMPLAGVRYEQYYRASPEEAAGFSVTAEAPPMGRLRLQGGYITIDEFFDGNSLESKLNADRIQRGRRVFVVGNVPIAGPLTAQIFVTRAFDAPYRITNRTRFDAVLQYDVLSVLRKTGKI